MMKSISRRAFVAGLGAVGLSTSLMSGTSFAETFPSKPVNIVVPFPAGGGGDSAVRLVSKALSEKLKVPVNVLNKPGGDGVIGGTAVARAEPDGYTLLFATPTAMNYAPAIHRTKPAYDPVKDFKPVSTFASYAFVFSVNSKLPVKTLAEFVDYVHKHPGEVNYGTGDATSIIAISQFAQAAKLDMVHIPYNGGAEAEADLAANRIQAMFLTLSSIKRFGDGVNQLAVLYPERAKVVPDLPTFKELGYASVNLLPWSGFFTTAGAPDDVVNNMSLALREVLREPKLVAIFEKFGNSIAGSEPAVLAKILDEQLVVWRHMVGVAGIKTD